MSPDFKCEEFLGKAIAVAAEPKYSTVVFGGAWADYLAGHYNSAVHRTELQVRNADGTYTLLTPNSTELRLVAGQFSTLMANLVRSGKRVVLLLPIPTRAEHIPKLLYRAIWENAAEPDLTIAQDRFQKHADAIVALLRSAAMSAGAEVFDPQDVLCKDGQCPVIAPDGRPLYSDDSHLRPFAVRRLFAFFTAVI